MKFKMCRGSGLPGNKTTSGNGKEEVRTAILEENAIVLNKKKRSCALDIILLLADLSFNSYSQTLRDFEGQI